MEALCYLPQILGNTCDYIYKTMLMHSNTYKTSIQSRYKQSVEDASEWNKILYDVKKIGGREKVNEITKRF